ncbi:MAG: mechanosensitive ion channel family protein [Proteobacteria bacterium]|nr:mechanosensitive ion channel family protein [Pseudomonadota bacterium]MBU1743143.1 mechanosensitive ion channel family protein [Pseudomonadota bacterium]
MDFLNYQLLQNSVWRWLIALGVAGAAYLVMEIVRTYGLHLFQKWAQNTRNEVDDYLVGQLRRSTKHLFIIIFALYAGQLALRFPPRVGLIADNLALITVFVLAALWANAMIKFWFNRRIRQKVTEDPEGSSSYIALSFLVRLALWTVVGLAALSNLGVNISTLLAGVGVGGVALALASQTILGDLFSSFAITLDKPFRVGDFIVVGDMSGTVEHIGLKTTRVRSLSGEQLVFGNSDLLKSRIKNYKRMQHRRIVFKLGVTYETPYQKLAAIPELIQKIIDDTPGARFDRTHFSSYDDFALTFEIVYFVDSPDYTTYMDVQQSINLAVFQRFEAEGVEFAYPTRTVYTVTKPEAGARASTPAPPRPAETRDDL